MMKKLYGVFILASLVVLGVILPAEAAPLQQAGPGASLIVNVQPNGSTVNVALQLVQVVNLYGMETRCTVNPAILTGTTRSDGAGFNSGNAIFVDRGFNATSGEWLIATSLKRPATPISGDVTAFSLTYTVRAAGSSPVNCTALAVDATGKDIPINVVNGNYNGGTGTQPTATTPGQPVPTATIVPTNVVPTAAPTQPPTVTAAPTLPATTPTGPATLTRQVSSSSDDANEADATFTTNDRTIWLGNAGTRTPASYTGLRFTNLTIPRGATISSARLEVYSTQNQWMSFQFSIAAEAADNSATFSSGSKPSQRPQTAQKVQHNSNVNWAQGTWYSLNEMAAVIQEVVNRPGWQSGNSISIILQGPGNSTWGRKFVSSFDGSAQNAPRLVITYAGGAPGSQPTAQPTAGTPGTISGSFVYQNSPDNAGITVALLSQGTPAAQVVTGANGAFQFTNVPAGSYTVRATAPQHLAFTQNVTVDASGQPVNIQPVTLMAGDTDNNGAIDVTDASFVGANYSMAAPPAPATVDLNRDKQVNISDLVLVGGNFGRTSSNPGQ